MLNIQQTTNLFEIAIKIIKSPDWKVGIFSSAAQPEQARLFCHRYTEVLKTYGFSNIVTSDAKFATLPGIYHVYIQDRKENLLVSGGRLHLGLPNVELPIERVISNLDLQLESYLNSQKSVQLLGEFSGFWVDKNYLTLDCFNFPLIHMIMCFSIGLALRYGVQKLICLSSQHMFMHASFFGFKTIETQGDHGKIPYPARSHSYYMECDVGALPLLRKDIWQLIYWARDNLEEL